jgi:hypothetical protein
MIRRQMVENDESVLEFDEETYAQHWEVYPKLKSELGLIYFFNYLAETDVAVSFIVYMANKIFVRCTSISLSIQRYQILKRAQKIHKAPGDYHVAYKCLAYFTTTQKVVDADLEITMGIPRLIRAFFEHDHVNVISNKAVPLIDKIYETNRLYKEITLKSTSR